MKNSPRPIYIVDDDPGVLNSMQFLLEAAGYNVALFLDGETFLNRIRSEAPACVIVDYKLPRTNGVDVVRSLHDRWENIPAIIITGHPDPAIRKRVEEATLPLIEKPFSQNLLLCAVKAASELNMSRDATP